MKTKDFTPKETSPTPWRVVEKLIWHSVIAATERMFAIAETF